MLELGDRKPSWRRVALVGVMITREMSAQDAMVNSITIELYERRTIRYPSNCRSGRFNGGRRMETLGP